MKPQKQVLTYCYAKAREQYKLGNTETARNYCDMGIGYCAIKKGEGMDGEELIEGIKINLWLDRFWQHLEKWGLML